MNYTETLCIVRSMIDNAPPKQLMSDSLQGLIPDYEDQMNAFQDAFMIAFLVLVVDGKETELTGSLTGLSLESRDIVKMDVRVKLETAYDVTKRFYVSDVTCHSVHFLLGNDVLPIEGNFKLSSPKIVDIDHQNKMCTLGVDLFRV
jgi:hypothetical protein